MYSLPTEHKIILTTFFIAQFSLAHGFCFTSYDIYQDVQSFPRERLTLNTIPLGNNVISLLNINKPVQFKVDVNSKDV